MIPRKYRLSGKKNIELLKREGKLFQSASFGLLIKKSDDVSLPKVGLIVSKKVARLASQRNKIKRKIRNCLSPFLLKLKKGVEILILAKTNIIDLTNQELQLEMETAFKKADII